MSGKVIQLDMFINEEMQRESEEAQEFKKSVSRCIKGLFWRYNEMERTILELNKKLDRLIEEKPKDV